MIPLIWDVTRHGVGEYREVTQDDVDRLSRVAQAYGKLIGGIDVAKEEARRLVVGEAVYADEHLIGNQEMMDELGIKRTREHLSDSDFAIWKERFDSRLQTD